jgi:hypothetical protein
MDIFLGILKHMKWLQTRRAWVASLLFVGTLLVAQVSSVYASPFGQGVFGADVPFGSGTSLAIALGGNVSLTLTPSGSTQTGSGSHTITVTSTDVVGYRLYIYSPTSTALANGSETIAASSNSTLGALALNTWGYNTNGSTNYIGVTSSPVVLKDANGPYKNGDNTTVKYGVYASTTKGAGDYTSRVVYTAVAKSQ